MHITSLSKTFELFDEFESVGMALAIVDRFDESCGDLFILKKVVAEKYLKATQQNLVFYVEGRRDVRSLDYESSRPLAHIYSQGLNEFRVVLKLSC